MNGELLFDRATEGRFPEVKEIKQAIRDTVAPKKDLGHSDIAEVQEIIKQGIQSDDDEESENEEEDENLSTLTITNENLFECLRKENFGVANPTALRSLRIESTEMQSMPSAIGNFDFLKDRRLQFAISST